MKKTLCLLGLPLLAACSAPINISSSPYDVVWKNKSASQGVISRSLVTIRSMTKGNKEVAGADCEINNPEYAVTFKTPAVVRLPFKGRQKSSAVNVTCTYKGVVSNKILPVMNLSGAERAQRATSATSGLGVIGAVAGLAIAAGVSGDRRGDVYGYPPEMIFELIPK